MKKKVILSHRGLCEKSTGIENSISAMKETYDIIKKNTSYLYGFEFDIQLSKDNKIVCYHDRDMLRVHGKDIVIKEEPYDSLKEYGVSLLTEILDYFKDKEVVLDIEIKVDDDIDDNYIHKISYLLHELLDYPYHKIIISSFNKRVVSHLIDSYGKYKIVPIFDRRRLSIDFLKKVREQGVTDIVLDKVLLMDNIDIIKKLNLNVFVYGVLDADQENFIRDTDVDRKILELSEINIITDRIDSIS